jgi:glycosyltransferase involved in cell wall biosynthesis
MTEWIARYCDAGLCHADFYRKRVLAACPGPVESAAMPVTPRKVAPLTLGASQLVALTVGVMNPNKCVDRVIEAIATSPQLSAQLSYRLVGPISPQESARLTALAEGLSYGGLQIHGAVDDAALDQHLSASDIICCLRRPVLEGASGSAIEGLLAGRPLIVVDAGFYAELPDELVFKIDQEAPVEELRARLEQLCADPALRLASGAAAAAWARRRFDLGGYVAALEGLAAAMVEAKPILRLGADFGRRLASLGLRADDPAVARIGAATSDLFGLVS